MADSYILFQKVQWAVGPPGQRELEVFPPLRQILLCRRFGRFAILWVVEGPSKITSGTVAEQSLEVLNATESSIVVRIRGPKWYGRLQCHQSIDWLQCGCSTLQIYESWWMLSLVLWGFLWHFDGLQWIESRRSSFPQPERQY
ncbi:uncharacterized protein [Procambarus clarkii]|uniref:uncharacterized protein n=1 Tax=Procambarus clarkii TaxID=6728 RepID=UPI0037442246